MASGLMRMVSSSGKSSRKRRAICSGLQAVAHRRSCRRPCRRPFHGTTGPRTAAPFGAMMTPASRSCTYRRRGSLIASLADFGRRRSGRRAIARSWPGTPDRRCAWRRCGAARARSWTARASVGGRSPAPRAVARARSRSPPARQTTDNALTAVSPPARDGMVACRPPSGTSGPRRLATPRPQPRRPHWSVPPRWQPRTDGDPHAAQQRADQARATRFARTDPNAASEQSSQPPLSRCCDDHLNSGWQDEGRVGQKNKIARRWARRGTRPRAPHDQRTSSVYIFGAICPQEGKGAALVLPRCDTQAMSLHLAEVAQAVAPGAHGVMLMDRAGWHRAKDLVVPDNLTLVLLPARAPELNPVENTSCATTGCRAACSAPTPTLSITAATPGTASSTSLGSSCPSASGTGPMHPMHDDQRGLVLWAVYAISPYFAAYRLVTAVQARDVEAPQERVTFHAVRIPLAQQILAVYFSATGEGNVSEAAARQLASVAAEVAEPLIAQLLSPEVLVDLLDDGWPQSVVSERAPRTPDEPASEGRSETSPPSWLQSKDS